MADGVKLTTVDASSLIDEMIATRDGSIVRVPFAGAAAQLAASGPLADAINALNALLGSGIQWKDPVAVATIANITLSGEQAIDGVLTSGSRILVKNQTNTAQNGIYVTASGAWSRAADADTAAEVKVLGVFVRGGTLSKGKQFVCLAGGIIVLGTTALPFVEISDQTALNAAIADLQAAQTAEETKLALIDAKIPNLRLQRGVRDRHVIGTHRKSQLSGNQYGPANFKSWMVGINNAFRAIQNPSAVGWWLFFEPGADVAQIGMRIYRRDGANPNGSGGEGSLVWPGAFSGDEIVQPLTWFDSSDVMADTKLVNNPQFVRLPILDSAGPFLPTNVYFAQIFARSALGAMQNIGLMRGRDRIVGFDPLWKTGGVSTDPTGASGITPADGGMVSYALFEAVFVEGSTEAATDQDISKVAIAGKVDQFQKGVSGSSWAVQLPPVSIDVQPSPIASDTTGVHIVNIDKVSSPNNVRYDTIVSTVDSGDLLVSKGSELQYGAYYSKGSTARYTKICDVRVSAAGTEVINTSEFDGLIRRGSEAKIEWHTRRNRLLLPKVIRAQHRGLPINLITYTDSIHAMSNGVTSDYYVPNGSNRDVPGYLVNYPSSLLATIPRFDGDGGSGAHVHIGAHWYLKEALERYGSLVQLLNMGIGGTTTRNTLNPDGTPNARHPDRLSALVGLIDPAAANLVYLNYGMNQLGEDDIYFDYVDLIASIKAAGAEVILTTSPRPGRTIGEYVNTDWWLLTTRRSIQAAIDGKCAWMDYSQLFGNGNLASFGMSAQDLCDANGGNHPGMAEHRAMGEYVSLNFN